MKTRLVFVAALLTACQSWQAHAPEHPPPHRGAGMGAGVSGEHMGMQGHQDMCTLHQQMMSAHTPEERQAMMEQAMPGMPREERERHLQMMQQRCPSMSR